MASAFQIFAAEWNSKWNSQPPTSPNPCGHQPPEVGRLFSRLIQEPVSSEGIPETRTHPVRRMKMTNGKWFSHQRSSGWIDSLRPKTSKPVCVEKQIDEVRVQGPPRRPPG